MDLYESTRREKWHVFAAAIIGAFLVSLVGPPVVEAATSTVKVKGPVVAKIQDSTGDVVVSREIPDMGLTASEGSEGALDVNSFPGGGGVLGIADCSAAEGASAPPGRNLPNKIEIPGGKIATAIIVTGNSVRAQISSEATDALILGAQAGAADYPITVFRTTPDNPNVATSLGTGLSTTAPLKMLCTAPDGTDADGNVIVLGR